MSTAMLEAALGYAARGWPVFVLTDRKTPFRNCDACEAHDTAELMEACECLHCHGFYAAATEPRRLKAMFGTRRRVCLAIRTGAASGTAVVDVDFRRWRDDGETPAADDPAWRSLCDFDARRLLPGTLMQTTASGGLHLIYAHPGGYLMSGANKYAPGLDSKADGGYIVAAPSVTPRGGYAWPDGRSDHPLTPLPDELAALVRPPERATVTPIRRTGLPGVRTRLRGLVDAVLNASDGERNDLLHWAAKKAGEMIAAGEVDQSTAVGVLQDAGLAVGLTAAEVGHETRGTIGSGLRKGLAAGRVVA